MRWPVVTHLKVYCFASGEISMFASERCAAGGGNTEQRHECGVADLAQVKAEHKPVEVGLQMGTAQAVAEVEGPDFDIGEDAVDPGRTTCATILPTHADRELRREQRVTGPFFGFSSRARRKVAGNERMQTVGPVVGRLGDTDPAGTAILDRTDDDDLALVTAFDTTRYRTILAAAGDLGFH
jgi:hypothetical protein